jgi:hypothetical protein
MTFDAGWNYMPVMSMCNVNLTELLTPVIDNVVMVKSIADIHVFWPEASIYTLQMLQPGKAYFANFDAPISLTFPECSGKPLKTQNLNPVAPQRWPTLSPTAVSHIIRIDASGVNGLEPGDILGAFTTSGQCAGAVTLTGSADALVLWGDDAATTAKKGFASDETITFRHWAAATDQEQTCEVIFDEMFPQQNLQFIANGMSAIKAIDLATGMSNYKADAISISPNPSSGVFYLQNLNGNETVEVSRLDGATISTLKPHASSCKLDLSRQAAGIYLLKITSEESFQATKIIIR